MNRRGFLAGGGYLALASGVATAADMAGCSGPGTLRPHAHGPQPGRVRTASPAVEVSGHLSSRYTGSSMGWTISTPGNGQRPRAIVFCLHAKGGNHRMAFDSIRVPQVAASLRIPLAVAAVDGGPDSYWHRRADGSDALAMLLKEFVPLVRARVGPLPQALMGWSMGGYGALLAAERSGRRFLAVSVASPALWLTPGVTAPGAFDSPADFYANDVFTRIEALRSMTVAVFCGTTDPFYPAARNLVSLMDFPHLARFGPGGHDPGYWRRVAPAQLRAIGGVRGSPQANRLSAEAGKSPQDVVEHPWLVGYADMKTLFVHLFNQFSLMYIRQMASSRQAAPAFLRLAGHPLRWRLLSELADSDLRVRELVALTGQPQNLVSYHLRLLRDGGLVTATRSTFDGRDSYYHLDLDHCARALAGSGRALHPALGATPALPPHSDAPVAVLFVCTGNSARSPMAEALLRHHAGGQIQATSAGTRPKPRLHACAVRVLRESYGIDISGHRPRDLRTLTGHRFDYVVSLCDKARETGFEFNPTARRIHWSIPDPVVAGLAGEAGYGAFAGAAAEVDSRIRHLLPVLATTVGKEIQP